MEDKIGAFLVKNACDIKSLSVHRDTSFGFNAFTLVSDIYYRENFHSDIIAAILSPLSNHGEGKLFLRLFIDYLKNVALRQNKLKIEEELRKLSLDDDISVKREDGRIDIKIQAPTWTIIIENKINGANDQKRQLPRYVDDCGSDNVKAIVYLTAANEKMPEENGWLPGDDKKVKPKLLPIVGFSKVPSIINLVDGWLSPCEELSSKGFITKSILSQYKELLKHQAGETMNKELVKKLLNEMVKNDVNYLELKDALQQMLQQMPCVIASMLTEHCADIEGLDTQPWIAFNKVAVFDFVGVPISNFSQVAKFAVDVHCEDLGGLGVSFFVRSESDVPVERYLPILQGIDSNFKYDKAVWEKRLVLQFTPETIKDLIPIVKHIVESLVRNRDELSRVAGKSV